MRRALPVGFFCLCFVAYAIEGFPCSRNFGGCDKANGLCWDTPLNNEPSSYCTCKSGFNFEVPATRSGNCVDIDECKAGLHNCDTVHGRCLNTFGSHRCVCNKGYVLDYSQTACIEPSKIQRSCHNYQAEIEKPVVQQGYGQRRPSVRRAYGQRRSSVRRTYGQRRPSVRRAYGQRRSSVRRASGRRGSSVRRTYGRRRPSVRRAYGRRRSSVRRASVRRRPRHRYHGDSDQRVKFFMDLLTDENKEEEKSTYVTPRCSCETGYELRSGCRYCQDINECKRKTSLCDLTLGYCHNSDGGYYCTCRIGYVLGPCGFKCYRASERPQQCTSKSYMQSALIEKDSDGLNDEASRAVVLDYMTEKAAVTATNVRPLETLAYSVCAGKKTKTVNYDLDRDGRNDLRVMYLCVNKVFHVKGVYNTEAYWTPWTCWTSCRPTCYGGIQTRTRICKHGLVGEGNCKGPATEYQTCYTGRRCKLRVRRNANTLTEKQRKDLIQAMEKYKKDTSTHGFHNAAGTHIFPLQCMNEAGNPAGCCYHGARMNFVMWHRAELLNFEEGLTRHLKDKTLGLPYWDWVSETDPPSFVWDKQLYGKKNPFASATVRYDTSPAETNRTESVLKSVVTEAQTQYREIAKKLMRAHAMHEFSEALENPHNNIHYSICSNDEYCKYSMAALAYASFDPIFFFHHTNVDRLFAKFQKRIINNNELAWTRQSVLEPQESIFRFNENMNPFRNKTLTPFKRLHTLPTMENMFYYKNMLGYKYDTTKVSKGTMTTKAYEEEKDHMATINDNLNIAQFESNTGANVKVTYYISNKLTLLPELPECRMLSQSNPRYIGEVTILGTTNERPWESRQATIVPFTRPFVDAASALSDAGLTRLSNFNLTACYTHNIGCSESCEQVPAKVRKLIPSPQLLLYPKNIRQDIFKFEWNSENRFPDWEIDFDSGSQWLQFWGEEAENIVQVSTSEEFEDCKTDRAKKVTCTQPCILQSGVHYFVDSNVAKCESGMKLRILANL